ncbi:MAG TPA: toll/interleukin-1 receptor domain-containing protein [Armatimonadota bacterium]|nr:toll/interleukin-1 receptor domain-containing protein [Armatimonadota bacterium]
MRRKAATKPDEASTTATAPIEPGGVFISHVHEDEPLAEAFELLIHNVSAGVVPTFRSTAKQFGGGIQYGEEWFRWICESVNKAKHIVALLTPASVSRPWILFEAGLGKGKSDGVVFGVGLGISREDAYKGPFAALQNCGAEEKELVKLCKELIEGTQAKPRDEMISKCVAEFRATVEAHFANQKSGKKASEDPTSVAVFQALEEMKLMLRDQTRMFETDMPRFPRRDRDIERLTMVVFEHSGLLESEPKLHLAFLAGLATELGYFFVKPLVDYIVNSKQAIPGERLDGMHFLLHDMFMRLEPRGKMDHHLLRTIEQALHTRLDQRLSSKNTGSPGKFTPSTALRSRVAKARSDNP